MDGKGLRSRGQRTAAGAPTPGALYAWGYGAGHRTALGVDRSVPTQVGTAATWTGISAGATLGCGLRDAGQLWCWGTSSNGALGGLVSPATAPTAR